MKNALLFTYGTLCTGLNNPIRETFDRNAQFIDSAFVFGKLFALSGYPGTKLGGSNKVYGELFYLSSVHKMLQRLDEYEECSAKFKKPQEYQRRLTRVYLHNGKSMFAWIYEYNWSVIGKQQIYSGNYRDYLSTKQFDSL